MTCQGCISLRRIFPELSCSCEIEAVNLGLRGIHIFRKIEKKDQESRILTLEENNIFLLFKSIIQSKVR